MLLRFFGGGGQVIGARGMKILVGVLYSCVLLGFSIVIGVVCEGVMLVCIVSCFVIP